MSEQDAEQLDAEANGPTRRTIRFGSGDGAVELELPRKWKRLKLTKAMARNDIWAGLSAIWSDEELEPLEDLDLDEDELMEILRALGLALGGGASPGN